MFQLDLDCREQHDDAATTTAVAVATTPSSTAIIACNKTNSKLQETLSPHRDLHRVFLSGEGTHSKETYCVAGVGHRRRVDCSNFARVTDGGHQVLGRLITSTQCAKSTALPRVVLGQILKCAGLSRQSDIHNIDVR